ncbi:MAG: small subunit ribosomal protein S11 [Candidatus Peregrinibacteria bacterium Greene0416_62]|nr:MAG: small subunit ribosomal protein S11 [Candidatus Peregrinibacteria bacterium Greene0416_62]TSD00223.1 MAG: small subunit ribosomal protein S11 [Candidatus Peregrinibacteria bacterium Greene1014_49]
MADEKKKSIVDTLLDTPAEAPAAGEAKPKARRKKVKRSVPVARVCIHASENNTIVTFTDLAGGVLCWSSAGCAGFKGTRKSTPYAAKVAAEAAAVKALPFGVQSVAVEIKGLGPGREQAIRGLQSAGLNLDAIVDVTPIPHGGCRKRRRRRV